MCQASPVPQNPNPILHLVFMPLYPAPSLQLEDPLTQLSIFCKGQHKTLQYNRGMGKPGLKNQYALVEEHFQHQS